MCKLANIAHSSVLSQQWKQQPAFLQQLPEKTMGNLCIKKLGLLHFNQSGSFWRDQGNALAFLKTLRAAEGSCTDIYWTIQRNNNGFLAVKLDRVKANLHQVTS